MAKSKKFKWKKKIIVEEKISSLYIFWYYSIQIFLVFVLVFLLKYFTGLVLLLLFLNYKVSNHIKNYFFLNDWRKIVILSWLFCFIILFYFLYCMFYYNQKDELILSQAAEDLLLGGLFIFYVIILISIPETPKVVIRR